MKLRVLVVSIIVTSFIGGEGLGSALEPQADTNGLTTISFIHTPLTGTFDTTNSIPQCYFNILLRMLGQHYYPTFSLLDAQPHITRHAIITTIATIPVFFI
ncbi:hypothetical protein ES703_94118 [subsurface metagenome]